MNEISMIEVFTRNCEWCTHQCLDNDKYEILVLCLNIQKKFAEILINLNLVLSYQASDTVNKITNLFEEIFESSRSINDFESLNEPIKNFHPGCSYIFSISQFLEQSFSF